MSPLGLASKSLKPMKLPQNSVTNREGMVREERSREKLNLLVQLLGCPPVSSRINNTENKDSYVKPIIIMIVVGCFSQPAKDIRPNDGGGGVEGRAKLGARRRESEIWKIIWYTAVYIQ